jgi:hypothetical protein
MDIATRSFICWMHGHDQTVADLTRIGSQDTRESETRKT